MTATRAPLHLLVINEFFYPDVCASSAVLSDHLPRIAAMRPEWRITVLTGDRAWDRPEVRWPAGERFGAIDIVRVPRPASGRTLWRRAAGFLGFHLGVTRTGKQLPRPDVVMASTAPPLGGRLGLRLARRFKCPLIYKVLDLYPDCATTLGVVGRANPLAWVWKRLDTQVMRESAAVVPIARGIADRIRRTRGLPPDRVQVIHDGFDPQRVRPMAPDANAFRREHGLQGKFVVQYAGNMGLSHPFDTILAAAEQLIADPRIVFQFIGAGPGRAQIESAARRRGPQIQLLDYQPAERLAEVLSAADAALISQDERMAELSLPYKFYGILAAARPCVFVGSAESEIADLLREHACGHPVRQGDAAGLAGVLRSLLNDPEGRESLGARGRELLETRFSSAAAATAWVELIERVAAAI